MHQTVTYGIPTGAPSQPAYQALFQPAPFIAAAGPACRPKVVEKFIRSKAIGIGTTLIVAAVLGAIFNAIEIGVSRDRDWDTAGDIGHGFWIGAVVSINTV